MRLLARSFFRLKPHRSKAKIPVYRDALRLTLFFLSLAPILLCIPSVVFAQPDSTQEVYEYVMQWGTTGSDTGQFNGASGMCIDDSGYIYVCDRWNHRIQKFDRNGNFILTWGRYGTGQGEFDEPTVLAADHSGYIYVHDLRNGRVQKFNSRGNFVLLWPRAAVGIAVGPSNLLYINDGGVSPRESIDVCDTLGNKLRSFGTSDTTEWWLPEGVAVDDSEFVYVSRNPGILNDIVKFDSRTDSVVLRWGSPGSGEGQFSHLYTLGSGEKNKVFAPDAPSPYSNHRVQKFTSGGVFVTQWGSQGNGNGQFQVPFSAVVDSEGYVYISDPSLNRIQKFRKTIVGVDVCEVPIVPARVLTPVSCLPNPVKTTAIFKYRLATQGETRLNLYNALGRRIRSFGFIKAGNGVHDLIWDGKDENGRTVSSGVYFISLESNGDKRLTMITVIR